MKKYLDEESKAFIAHYLSNKSNTSFELPLIPVAELQEYIESLGWTIEESEESTNGWQVDFWYYFWKGYDKVCLSGSLFYGDYKLTHETN